MVSGHDEPFTTGMLTWNDPRLAGKRRSLDKALGQAMGGSAVSGLDKAADVMRSRIANPTNKSTTVQKSKRALANIELMQQQGVIKDIPTTIDTISSNYEKILNANLERGRQTGEGFPGLGWYFDQRRGHAAAGNTPQANDIPQRRISGMAGVASSGKSPKDEIASVQGTTELLRHHGDKFINGRAVASIPSEELGKLASLAASWHAHEAEPTKSARPSSPRPSTTPDVFHSLKNAGRAHEGNVSKNVAIGKGEIPTGKIFNPANTPKTAAYAEMQYQSAPDSDIEADYRSIGAHFRDIAAGTQSPDQGLLLFSQTDSNPKTRAYPLRNDSPTAIDTWMIAAGSGQPMVAHRGGVDPKTGKGKGRTYSPAKMMVDKDMPMSPTDITKGALGISGNTDASVTPVAVSAAAHNEAIQRLSRRIGPISHDQFGNDIHLPSSMVQEGVWTEGRRQANSDEVYNAMVREQEKQKKQSTPKPLTKKEAKEAEDRQPRLF